MKRKGPRDSHTELPEWESQVNQLLDGELDETSTDALKRAATEDQELARVIVEAYELQRDMGRLGIEKAPLSLRKKLRRIPRTQKPRLHQRRWFMATAMASVPLLAVTLFFMQPQQPSPADVEKARQDLAVAFSYIDKVGNRTGGYLQNVLGAELRHGVTDNFTKHFPYTGQTQEEENS